MCFVDCMPCAHGSVPMVQNHWAMLEASWSSGLHFSGFKKVSDLCVHPKWKKVKAKCALQDVQKYKEHKNEYRGHWMSIADEHVTPQFEVDKCSQRIGVPADVSYFFCNWRTADGPMPVSHSAYTAQLTECDGTPRLLGVSESDRVEATPKHQHYDCQWFFQRVWRLWGFINTIVCWEPGLIFYPWSPVLIPCHGMFFI